MKTLSTLRLCLIVFTIFIALGVLSTTNAQAQCCYESIISDDFESGWGNWVDGGADCRRNSGDAAYANSGTYCVRLQDNTGTSVMSTGDIDLSGYVELTVDFSMISNNLATNEDFWLQVSTNGGSSYSTVADYNQGTEFSNGVRSDFTAVISGPFTSTTRLRFRCDASANADRVYIDDVVVTGDIGDITSYPYSESFETGLGCWTQDSGEDFDWTRQTGSTTTGSTGPSAANDGSYYMYTESSAPNNPSKVAILQGPCLDLTSLTSPGLTFDYHMYGSNMGTLDLLSSSDDGSTWNNIWTKSGDQTDNWYSASVDLDAVKDSTVIFRFKGTTGTSQRSDMAIDNIVVDELVVNTKPVADDDADNAVNDESIQVDVLTGDTDADGDDLTINAIITSPDQGGTAVINNNGTPANPADDWIDFTPSGSYIGNETFEYEICDNGAPSLCDTALVTITVAANTAPVAVADADTTRADTPINVDVLGNDSDVNGHQEITITSITVAPNHGATAVIDTNGTGDPSDDFIVFTPEGTYEGSETFTYQICDDGVPSLCSTAVVTVYITPNTAPVAVADAASTPNDDITIDVLANDSDADVGDEITITSITVAPNNGGSAVINNNGTPADPTDDYIDYSPEGTYFGDETFTYQICDDGAPQKCSTAVVTVTVSENTAPVATDDADATDESTAIAVDVLLNDSDADGHDMTITSVTTPDEGGTAVINNNGTGGDPTDDWIDYTPSGVHVGTETFDYIICDDGTPSLCDTATVTITITGSSVQTVSNTNDSGAGSIRQAILDANSNPGLDVIDFNITGAGPHEIVLATKLPDITDTTWIDGFSQSGASNDDDGEHTIMIQLDGDNVDTTGADHGKDGLVFATGADDSWIRGISIVGMLGSGLEVNGADGVHIYSNFVGLDAAGTTGQGNLLYGIVVRNGDNCIIGEEDATRSDYRRANVVSGNAVEGTGYVAASQGNGYGIEVKTVSGCIIRGNIIGLNPAGTTMISTLSTPNNDPTATMYTTKSNNAGVSIRGEYALIDRNVISKTGIGVNFSTAGCRYNDVTRNIIGLDKTGMTKAMGASGAEGIGVYIKFATGNMIGGTTAADGNTIANGVTPSVGATCISILADSNFVQFNKIGTDITGRAKPASGDSDSWAGRNGINLTGSAEYNRILDNTVAYGLYSAIRVDGDHNIIQRNYVGTNSYGDELATRYEGISVAGDNNLIGGIGNGNIVRNTVQGDWTKGAVVATGSASGNTFLENSIYDTGSGASTRDRLAIDLGNDGVTDNDIDDSDTGPNALINFPWVYWNNYNEVDDELTIAFYGIQDDAGIQAIRYNFYGNPSGSDDSEHGECELHLGYVDIPVADFTARATVTGDFTRTISYSGPTFDYVYGTATEIIDTLMIALGTPWATRDGFGSTSEMGGNGGLTLPVELAEFKGSAIGCDARIEWSTASEINNDYFEIEFSKNGLSFAAVGRVQGAGFSSEMRSYSLDIPQDAPLGYYRLKQVDYDGTTDYSEIILVRTTCGDTKDFQVQTFPNPAVHEVNIIATYEVSRIFLMSLDGRIIREYGSIDQHAAQHTLDISEMPPGVYLISVLDDLNQVTHSKITKTK